MRVFLLGLLVMAGASVAKAQVLDWETIRETLKQQNLEHKHPAIDKLIDILSRPAPRSALLLGQMSAGKTFLTSGLAKELAGRRNVNLLVFGAHSAPDLLGEFLRSASPTQENILIWRDIHAWSEELTTALEPLVNQNSPVGHPLKIIFEGQVDRLIVDDQGNIRYDDNGHPMTRRLSPQFWDLMPNIYLIPPISSCAGSLN